MSLLRELLLLQLTSSGSYCVDVAMLLLPSALRIVRFSMSKCGMTDIRQFLTGFLTGEISRHMARAMRRQSSNVVNCERQCNGEGKLLSIALMQKVT